MNIGRLAEDNIRRFGEYPLVYCAGQWHTNAMMNRRANQLGNALKQLGIQRGDRVGVQLLNSIDLMQAFFAVFKIGAVLVPINPALRAGDLAYLYRDAGMAALISHTDYLHEVSEARRQAPDLNHLILIGENIPAEALSLEALMARAPEHLETAETDNDDTAVLIYTAGTTGNPKGVMLTHYNWYSHVTGYYEQVLLDSWGIEVQGTVLGRTGEERPAGEAWSGIFGVSRDRIALITLPLFHGFGVFALNLEFLTGGKLVLMRRWDAEEAMWCIDRFKVTEFRGVPTMYIQVLNHPELDRYDLSSLKTCICGAAPMPLEVASAWKKRFGVDIWEGYGLSEATTVNCGNLALRRPPKYGSVGVCYQKANIIKIFDPQGRALPAGRLGEVVLKGPAVMKGYWNKPEETAEALRGGWLHTGDIGYMDEEGYLYITDRKKDLIVRGGENVYPKEVENVLYQHPQVLEAGVIGIPDPLYGESVKAFITPKSPGAVDAEAIMDFCRKHLPAFKRPSVIQFVDALPKSAVGKILRRKLREMHSDSPEA